MSKTKLDSIIKQQIIASTEFWAGKPKLTKEELSAVAAFAKKKGKALDEFFSNEENKSQVDVIIAKVAKKK